MLIKELDVNPKEILQEMWYLFLPIRNSGFVCDVMEGRNVVSTCPNVNSTALVKVFYRSQDVLKTYLALRVGNYLLTNGDLYHSPSTCQL